MNAKARLLCLSLAAITLLLCSGCAEKNKDDSTVPWARPANWEGQMPGFAPGGSF